MQEALVKTIEYARQRCHALSRELEDLDDETYPSLSPQRFLGFVKEVNRIIQNNLDEIEHDSELIDSLNPQELEQTVKRYCQFLPYLCNLLEYLEGSDVHSTPAALIRPLKRLFRRYLPGSDIIFRCYSQLNYSFAPLTRRLRTLFTGDIFQPCLKLLPDFFAVVSFPKIESNYVLLHCIVGHEIGHGLYQHKNLGDALIPAVKIDKPTLAELTRAIMEAETQRQQGLTRPAPGDTEGRESLRIKQRLTRLINKVIGNWVEELAADAFGVCIFGPAYFFAFINFVAPVTLLRSSSDTHPSPSIRMKLMWHMIKAKEKDGGDNLGFETAFDEKIKEFAHQWMQAAELPGQPSSVIYDIVERSITGTVLSHISSEVLRAMSGSEYTVRRYSETIPTLSNLTKNLIPPNEVVDFEKKKTQNSDVVSILNAGWDVYLSHMEEFAQNLKLAYLPNKLECNRKLNELLLKGLELNEIKTRWDEIGND